MWSFPYLNETQDLTDAVRQTADGSFVPLTDGVCHYELFSPAPAGDASSSLQGKEPGVRTIVLIHGFSVPYFIWDPTFAFLCQSGFRVLRYDLFGRGLSDRPRVRYGLNLYIRQLRDLLDALDLRGPVTLAGLSMGGPISLGFTEQHPTRVERNILIDPAGAKAIQLPLELQLAKIPWLSDLVFGLIGDETLLKGIASDFYDPSLVEEFIDRYRPQMKIKGFKRAILSTLRSGMLDDFSRIYRRVGQLGKPTLLFWGRNDTTVPFAHSDLARAFLPQAEFHVIEGVGHIPHYEKAAEFNPLLLQFLNSGS